MVGRHGLTLRYGGPGAITGTRLLAGEIGNTDPTQRGASEERFFFDGRAYAATPDGRPVFGGPTGQ